MTISPDIQAGLWGLLAGSALIVGAALAWFARLPQRAIAAVMAFGAGVLISALSFELMGEAFRQGGFVSTAAGFVAGAAVFTVANWQLARAGARHRTRSGRQHVQESQDFQNNNGSAIALGALLDGIPESIVIGLTLLAGGKVSLTAVCAIFLSNIPQGLSSAAGMKKAGRSAVFVFGLWVAIALISGAASLIGYYVFDGLAPEITAATIAFAAGAILSMLADTMMPEAFEEAHDFTGFITVLGFLAAFCLSQAQF